MPMLANMVVYVFCISDDSFVVGSGFELLFNIRPRNQTGLLLHVGASSMNQYGPAEGHYLTVYMLRGEVSSKHVFFLENSLKIQLNWVWNKNEIVLFLFWGLQFYI